MKEKKTIKIKNFLKKMEKKSFFLSVVHRFYMWSNIKIFGVKGSIKQKFKSRLGYKLNLINPQTFNEKIQWLKINYFQDFYIESSDKYLVREYLQKKLKHDYCVPLLFCSKRIADIDMTSFNSFPCILKISNGSGQNLIIKDKNSFSNSKIKKIVKKMIYEANTHARYGCEPQYLKKQPYILVEKLLETKEKKIPNDYKFFYFNGHLEFIYCSVDRFGENTRHIYDEKWNRLNFILLENANEKSMKRNAESKSIEPPQSFELMKHIGNIISSDYPFVRIDFYDVDGSLFIGEITLHHGSGHDMFYPKEYDLFFGKKLLLPNKNFELKI